MDLKFPFRVPSCPASGGWALGRRPAGLACTHTTQLQKSCRFQVDMLMLPKTRLKNEYGEISYAEDDDN